MDVIIDGERNFEVQGEPPDVLSVVAAVSDYLRDRGLVILEISADEEAVTPDNMLSKLEGRPLADVRELRIGSESLSSMVTKCLDELAAILPDLPNACRSLSEVFHSESPEDGYEPFQELANIWSLIKTREILVVDALRLDLNTLEAGGKVVAEMHSELNAFLEEAAQALQNGDCVLLGDLLEYELAPRAEAEAEIVARLQEHASTTTG